MTLSAQPNFKTHFAELLHQAASRITPLDAAVHIELARAKQASHGDYSCNLAMQLAKPLHKNPREIAQLLIDAMPASPYLEKIEIAGAGFINLFLNDHGLNASHPSPFFAEAGIKVGLWHFFEIHFPLLVSSNIQSITGSVKDRVRVVFNLDFSNLSEIGK